MDDLGAPSSYLSLEPGTPVYSSDGEKLGEVQLVLADQADDIFDGIVIDTSVLPGGHRFADAVQVKEIFEAGVVLTIDRSAAESLPKPSENAAVMEVGADELAGGGHSKLHEKLARAWELLSGK